MQDVAGLLALLILGGTLAAAVVGARALLSPSPDAFKLKLAAWLITVPWAITIVFGDDAAGLVVMDVLTGGVMIVSPLVAIALLTGVWLRRPRPAVVAMTDGVSVPVSDIPPIPPRPISFRRGLALIGELRLPKPAAAGVFLAIVLPFAWLFGRPSSGGGHMAGGLAQLGWLMLVSGGTFALSLLAILLAFLFLTRPNPNIAVTYAWLALAVVAGHVSFWLAADSWLDELDDIEGLILVPTSLFVFTSLAALLPAVAGQAAHAARWPRANEDPVWNEDETSRSSYSDKARFIWLVVVPAVPGLVLTAAVLAFELLLFVGVAPVELGRPAVSAFRAVSSAAYLWEAFGLPAIAIMATVGWIAIQHAGDVYRQRWKQITVASVVAWLIIEVLR